ncbi:MAG: sigma-70 family RNA polymerase sigma factor [Nitrospirae bacterium]|nr:sigma-70 family RNA polymerase sigma factor [Nitrospirota bacterium]
MKSSDTVKTYLEKIRAVPLLTAEEEIELARSMEDHRIAILQELLDSGVLTEEIFKLRRDLLKMSERKEEGTNLVSESLPDDEVTGDDLLKITDEIIDLIEGGRDNGSLKYRILDADRLTGIIEKTVERIRGERQSGEETFKETMSLIDDHENKMQEVKDRFIRANLRLAADIARKYSMNDAQLMDLIQEGNIGLMRAVDKFDYRKGYRFSTYATWWIKQYIMKSALLSATSLNIPAHILSKINKMMRTSVRFIQENGREPTPEELSEKMGLPVEKITGLMAMIHKEVSLETPAGEDGESTISDFVEDKEQASPADDIISDELMNELDEALSVLSPKEEKVLRMKFGIGESKRYSMEEIAKKLKINRERVSQIETKAMRKLRHPKTHKSLKIFLDK